VKTTNSSGAILVLFLQSQKSAACDVIVTKGSRRISPFIDYEQVLNHVLL
jgi:hypothetical protein